MTEIGKISSGAQVLDLQRQRAAQPASNAVDRFSGTQAQQSGRTSEAEQLSAIEKKAEEDQSTPLERAANALEAFLPKKDQTANTRLRIDKDDETGRFVYKNVDAESGEVLEQFPPESILEFLSYYREVAGLAVDDKA